VLFRSTAGIPWQISYGAFTLAMGLLGFGTYHALRYFERRAAARRLAARRRKEA
jgi:magnesium transporter